MFKIIRGDSLPQSDLPFSPAVQAGPFIFVSGQASVDDEGRIVRDTFAGEMRRSITNLERVLAGAGLGLEHVVKVCSYVGRQEDLAEYNSIYREFFKEPYPARTTLIGSLGDILKFEVDAVAIAKG